MLSTAQADPTPWLPLLDSDDWVDGEAPADTKRANNYYRARYYDPKIGRFVSEDPIGFKGGINFYGYVRNRPVTFTDPDGLQAAMTSASAVIAWQQQCALNAYNEEYAAAEARTKATPGHGGWRYAHCMASCRARKCGMPGFAIGAAGRGLEIWQAYECIFTETGWTGPACETAMADADRRDNRQGYTCPPEMPCERRCKGWLGEDKGPPDFGPFWRGRRE
jgi:RHS repeat-associated protein